MNKIWSINFKFEELFSFFNGSLKVLVLYYSKECFKLVFVEFLLFCMCFMGYIFIILCLSKMEYFFLILNVGYVFV